MSLYICFKIYNIFSSHKKLYTNSLTWYIFTRNLNKMLSSFLVVLSGKQITKQCLFSLVFLCSKMCQLWPKFKWNVPIFSHLKWFKVFLFWKLYVYSNLIFYIYFCIQQQTKTNFFFYLKWFQEFLFWKKLFLEFFISI